MPHSVKIDEILRTTQSWEGSPLPGVGAGKTEFRVLVFKIAPGGKTTIHMHPLNGAGYMIAGELTMYATEDHHGNFADPKQVQEVKLKPGDAWTEWHYGENKGKEEVVFVLVYVGQEGTPPTLSLGTRPK
jgi:oxalate decarboxylase/phosphoglucose isomerase-like protein (cupin superfamily)